MFCLVAEFTRGEDFSQKYIQLGVSPKHFTTIKIPGTPERLLTQDIVVFPY